MIVFSIILLSGFSWFFFTKSGVDFQRLFWIALLFKIAMGIALGLVYVYYYEANDTWLFFEDATRLAALGRSDFFSYLQVIWNKDSVLPVWHELVNTQERSLFLVKVISIFALLSGDNYWICSVYFSFLSFLASWHFFRVVSHQLPQSQVAAALAFLFFPSVLFWSSGLVKETLALAGIYFVAATFIELMKEQKIDGWKWLLVALSCWIAWSLKYYWTALFIAVIITSLALFLLQQRIKIISRYKLPAWLFTFLLLSALASLLHPNFYVSRFLDVLVTNHNDFVRISKPESLIHYYQLQANGWSVLINSPWALVSGLFRPFVWEASNLVMLLAAVENLLLVVLTVSLLVSHRQRPANRLLLFSTVFYVVLLCIFLALSTPNLGTLSRYRVGFLPFFVFLISYRNPIFNLLTKK